jgi:hypothetical protein
MLYGLVYNPPKVAGVREPVFIKLCVYRWGLSITPPGDGVAKLLGGGVASFVRTQ